MSTIATLKPGNQLWGIDHTDREYARLMGDHLRSVVEAPNKLAAEKAPHNSDSVNLGRTPCRQKRHSGPDGFLNVGKPTANDPATRPHAASTFDYAHTDDRSNPNRHPSAEEVRRTHQPQRCKPHH
jgi:hypothetical protein